MQKSATKNCDAANLEISSKEIWYCQ